MLKKRGVLNSGEKTAYSRGVTHLRHRGLRIESQSGDNPGYRSEMIRVPSRDLTVVCLANLFDLNPRPLLKKLIDLYLGEIRGAEEKFLKISSSQLAEQEGSFQNPITGATWEVSVEGDRLKVTMPVASFVLRPISHNKFVSLDSPVRIEMNFHRQGDDVSVEIEGQKPALFRRVVRWSPALEELEQYVGTYVSDELGLRTGSLSRKAECGFAIRAEWRCSCSPLCKTSSWSGVFGFGFLGTTKAKLKRAPWIPKGVGTFDLSESQLTAHPLKEGKDLGYWSLYCDLRSLRRLSL